MSKERYVYQPSRHAANFETCSAILEKSHPVVRAWVDNIQPATVSECVSGFEALGLPVAPLEVDLEQFAAFRERADYAGRYSQYYPGVQLEKALEHYVSFRLLAPRAGEVFVDVASEGSPLPEILSGLTGCTAYRQDIMYPEGIHGDQIGGDACVMPLEDGFVHKVSLTCSLEHFETDADVRLFRELSRVLEDGGAVCVVPFYVHDQLVNQTDPTVSVGHDVAFDPGATVYCARGWGNRFGRFYTPQSFHERIARPLKDVFNFQVHQIINAPEVGEGIYARLSLLATRKPAAAVPGRA